MSGLAEYRVELGALVWTAQLSDEDRDRLVGAGATVTSVADLKAAAPNRSSK